MIDSNNYKVGIYLRLSREDNLDGESSSITTQRELILNYINDNSYNLVCEYVDDGVSGTTFNRCGFKQMIRDILDKKINMVITKDTSRLGRDHIEFGYYVEKFFPEHGVRYVAINDFIDTIKDTSNNDMLVFKSAFNDMYVRDISNKMRTSLYTKKRSGKFVGCYAPFGYNKSINNKYELVINEKESVVVSRIFDMVINGYSVSKICDVLTNEHVLTPSQFKNMTCGQNNLHVGVWSNRTVSDILKNPTYMGNLCQCRSKKINYKVKKRVHQKRDDWIICKNSCPAIISEKRFLLVQKLLESNKNKSSESDLSDLLLRGLVYCHECGHTIGFRKNVRDTLKYGKVLTIYGNCNYWAKRKNECSSHSLKYDDIVDKIILDIKNKLKYLDKDKLILYLKKNDSYFENMVILENNRDNLKRKKKTLIDRIDKTYIDKIDGLINEEMYRRIKETIDLDISETKIKINELENKLLELENDNRDDSFYIDIIDGCFNNINRELICSLIRKIEISCDGTINIFYRFNSNFCEL